MIRTGRHYIVRENTPGYMPDNEPAIFRYATEALNYAASLADELREQGYRVSGNKRDGYRATDTTKMHDLGRLIVITEDYGEYEIDDKRKEAVERWT